MATTGKNPIPLLLTLFLAPLLIVLVSEALGLPRRIQQIVEGFLP